MLFSSEPPDPMEEPELDETPDWQPAILEDLPLSMQPVGTFRRWFGLWLRRSR